MNLRAVILVCLAGLLNLAADQPAAPGPAAPPLPAFNFKGIDYWHRWSQGNQHEYTPKDQENLEKWADLVTVNIYPAVHDGDALAETANSVLENYKNHGARILKTNSLPRTAEHPAEHFIAVVFGRPNFIEVAFARFKLMKQNGASIVYSHRIYGEKVGDPMSTWLKANGDEVEKALMAWEGAEKLDLKP